MKKGFLCFWGAMQILTTWFWGSSNVSARGEALLQYLALTDLRILNRVDDPTFVNAVRREVIDLTLCLGEIEPYLRK